MIRTLCILSVFLAFFLSPKSVFAVDLSLDHPSEITTREFELTYKTSGAKTGTNYLRVMVRKLGETSYVSETWNGSDWYSGGEGEKYLPVQVGSFESSGTIKARLKDSATQGEYEISLRRYSQSGSQAQTSDFKKVTFKFSDNVKTNTEPVKLTVTPTPTPSPSPTIATFIQDIQSESEGIDDSVIVETDGDFTNNQEGGEVEEVAASVTEFKEQNSLGGALADSTISNISTESQAPQYFKIGSIVVGLLGFTLILISLYQIAVKVKYLI